MAAKANIVIDQGTTFQTQLNLSDDNGLPVNLTGYTVESQLRKWYTSNNAVNFDSSVQDANNGIIELTLTANATANLVYGRYVYDVVTIDHSGIVTRVIEGIVTVTPEVTTVVYP
jgi:hypothetical protein